MTRSQVTRWLRIAWSVWWGILCVLLVVLWVRSAHSYDHAQGSLFGLQKFSLHSIDGSCSVVTYFGDMEDFPAGIHSEPYNKPPGVTLSPWAIGRSPSTGIFPSVQYFAATPHWLPVAVLASLSVAPWFSLKFSLRTLFIATTVVAVILGLVVWSIRS